MKKYILSLVILSTLLIFGCNKQNNTITIAISKAKPAKYYAHYPKWIHKADADAQIINMYELGVDSALQTLRKCDGLLITGGADVYPGWYGKLSDTARCGSFDFYRDTLEMALIKEAIKLKMPLIGICRGEQIINVTLGGSLIIDIPTDHDTIVKHRLKDWKNCYHQVDIVDNSLLNNICKTTNYLVNSNHHQAVDDMAPKLHAVAFAQDEIVEAIEWKQAENKSFLLAVQWHPERLDSANVQLSLPIAREFIFQARKYHTRKNK